MSLQSSAGVPPAPLIPGSVNVGSVEVAKNTKTFGKFVVPKYTQAQRDLLNATPGQIIYNTTSNALNIATSAGVGSFNWEEIAVV